MLISSLWASDSFKVFVWDSVANMGMVIDKLFTVASYPFVEAYTSNIDRYRPICRDHFIAGISVASLNADKGQAIKCSGIYDLDVPELQRQYPDIEWDRSYYTRRILEDEEDQIQLTLIRFKQVSVNQMLNQTTITIPCLVDVPMSGVRGRRRTT